MHYARVGDGVGRACNPISVADDVVASVLNSVTEDGVPCNRIVSYRTTRSPFPPAISKYIRHLIGPRLSDVRRTDSVSDTIRHRHCLLRNDFFVLFTKRCADNSYATTCRVERNTACFFIHKTNPPATVAGHRTRAHPRGNRCLRFVYIFSVLRDTHTYSQIRSQNP